MNIKNNQNEILVGLIFLIMIYSFYFKNNKINAGAESRSEIQIKLTEIEEIIYLKGLWDDKEISSRLSKFGKLSSDKAMIKKSKKKLTASYSLLNSIELNKVISAIASLPVEILSLKINNIGKSYNMEFKCRW